jgi:hypothetical protein
MLRNTLEKNFVSLILVCFFLMSVAYNMAYFYAFGDALDFFLYIPMGILDLLKTGAMAFMYTMIFVAIFRNIFIDPVFNNEFPSVTTLLFLSVLVFISNLFYFLILDASYASNYYLISEIAFFAFSLVAFFGILYFFSREQSLNFLTGTFFASLIMIAFFTGWLSAKFDIKKAPFESKSKILLTSDKVITAKILRSFDKGILVMLGKSNDINFISWDQIKEAKFKKISGF